MNAATVYLSNRGGVHGCAQLTGLDARAHACSRTAPTLRGG